MLEKTICGDVRRYHFSSPLRSMISFTFQQDSEVSVSNNDIFRSKIKFLEMKFIRFGGSKLCPFSIVYPNQTLLHVDVSVPVSYLNLPSHESFLFSEHI